MPADSHRPDDPLADRRAAYAEGLAAEGDFAAAADLMRQAIDIAPGWHAGRMRLGEWLERSGERDAAASEYETVLAAHPADAYGAGLKLAALGYREAPAAPPPAFVAGLFDQYAGRFEDSLVGKLGYRAPDLLLDAIRAARPDARFAAALDLGCGTGLMGERLRPLCTRLVGVDLSAGMLAEARRKAIYDALHLGDIAEPIAHEPGPFDLVAAADVLTYLGDLAPVLARASSLLAPAGLFACTVEASAGTESFELRPSLRYAHAPARLAERAAERGLRLLSDVRETLRRDRGEPVGGAVMLFAKA
ncbi:class I SAM-dependent DNA methyltransferase [Antarcticirhabdus aurantiaca]|uniref:Methyltransferase domain-containing protein n=1 Tax=Antarcticirhabdus aurantiaca TaxID=2606717 RepID=A0ACD4NJC7_9HYPH|nr:methyltransferase [Antarcticirhabdus aurantiaca]WAJ26791.1 methyltransferase domain-containing protein [Jeongeuplla avenae]